MSLDLDTHPRWTGLLMVIYREGEELGLLSGISVSGDSNPLTERYKPFPDEEMGEEQVWEELDYLEALGLVATECTTDGDKEILKIRLTPDGLEIAHQMQFKAERLRGSMTGGTVRLSSTQSRTLP